MSQPTPFGFETINDIETLNVVFNKLAEPYHEAFSEAIKDIEAEFLEFCAPFSAEHDRVVDEAYSRVMVEYTQVETAIKQQMDKVRREALRKIKDLEGRLHRKQTQLQAKYEKIPVVAAARAKLKSEIAEKDAWRDAQVEPHKVRMLEAMRELNEAYQARYAELDGGGKIRRVDK